MALPSTRRIFERDTYIVREGEPPNNCNLILRGFAFRQKLVSNGARQIISLHIPGEFVDLQNILFDVADDSVQSLGRSEVAVVPKAALTDLFAANPNIRRAAWLDTLVDASVFREWVVNLGRRDARGRIAHLLCELMARLKASGLMDSPVCDFPLTQEQIADATGLTPVHTNRTLQMLRRDGLINLSSSKLTILDWKKLADIGDFNDRYLHHAG
ncbi:Crp/Fnr family transcriptional regulator [Sphingomonas piscis]|uniref:Crp/Fnr family transcriptional regulator n=1 Tax=Sphingomonas piscis TaxID=2714943 RepID=A0A6G7YNH8_9SPHN|nr:Crp/Fnr family transcriptional regulator [Sphingomonas piscis]QIK78276.1 Crp/Fnr family transcriptional regulator [Sphingomonas piscis]